MKKISFWSVMLLFIAGLAACAPETPEEGTALNSTSGESGIPSSAESEPIEVAGDFPAANFAQAVAERGVDHSKGADNPVLTVIEYGDFQ